MGSCRPAECIYGFERVIQCDNNHQTATQICDHLIFEFLFPNLQACAAQPTQPPHSDCNKLVPAPAQAMPWQIMKCRLNAKCCWQTGPGNARGCRTARNLLNPHGEVRAEDGKCKAEEEVVRTQSWLRNKSSMWKFTRKLSKII